MAKTKKSVILKEDGQFNHVYIMGAKIYYAKVQSPQQKYKAPEGEREYALTAFVDEKTKEALLDLPVNSAKSFAEVGVDVLRKGRNRGEIKYPLDKYPDCEGLFGFNLNCPEFSKAGKKRTIKIIDKKGEDIESLIGNGSVANIKTLAYKNQDEEWNMQLSLLQVTDLIEYESDGEVEDDVLGVSYGVSSAKSDDNDSDDDVPFDTGDDDDGEEY